ncbi:MAG: glycine-rich protein, partial [Bacteroidales bacterium]|nr:glycine-rich protein [Bacteroidales bacterium]
MKNSRTEATKKSYKKFYLCLAMTVLSTVFCVKTASAASAWYTPWKHVYRIMDVDRPEIEISGAASTTMSCGTVISMEVINPASGYTYVWATDASMENVVYTGTTYSDVHMYENTTFYVRARSNSTSEYEGESAILPITVVRPATPIDLYVSATDITCGDTIRLSANTVMLPAEQRADEIYWYTSIDGQAPLFRTLPGAFIAQVPTGDVQYYAEAATVNGACRSIQRAAVDPVYVTQPSAPEDVTATVIYCGGHSVLTINDPNPRLVYRWFSDPECQHLVYEGTTFTTGRLTENTQFYVRGFQHSRFTRDFEYTGNVQTFAIAEGIDNVTLEVWGAQGGGRQESNISDNGIGGMGGYSVGTLNVTPGMVLNVYVGGQGHSAGSGRADGGWNGGGTSWGSSTGDPASGGGGATDIRINSESLYARVIVAGGGGGGGEDSEQGGYGGGTSGSGSYAASQGSYGSGGAFGLGANTSYDGGAGGGGWYGAGAAGGSQTIPTSNSTSDGNGGSGGSGYIYTSSTASSYPSGCLLNSTYYLYNAQTIAGNSTFTAPDGSSETGHSGNGYARISGEYDMCSTSTVEVKVFVNDMPAPTQVAASTTQIDCGEVVTLSALTSIDSTWTEWYDQDDNLIGTSTDNSPLTISPDSTATYYAVANNASNCSARNSNGVTVTVNQTQAPQVENATPAIYCGDSITLRVSNPSDLYTYLWYDDEACTNL